MRRLRWLLWSLSLACAGDLTGKIADTADETDADTGRPGRDGDADSDSDSDGDADGDREADLEDVYLKPDTFTFETTRESAGIQAFAQWSDGSETEVTDDCLWGNDDPAVAQAIGGVVYPLGEGGSRCWCTVLGLERKADVTVEGVAAPQAGELAFNEVLADVPPSTDVNGDGVADSTEDEFVEIVNAGAVSVALDGIEIWDSGNDTPRHTFADDTVLIPGQAIVVFGGGAPQFGRVRNCSAVIADNDDNGLQHGLALNNEGDTVTLRNQRGVLLELTYDDDYPDESMVLDPEIDGTRYTGHQNMAGSVGPASPCTLADGSDFPDFADRL